MTGLQILAPSDGKPRGFYTLKYLTEDVAEKKQWPRYAVEEGYPVKYVSRGEATESSVERFEKDVGARPDYLMGSGVSVSVAKSLGILVRKRLPGGGRNSKPIGTTRETLTVRVRPDVKAGIHTAAALSDGTLSAGEIVDALWDQAER